MYLQTAILVVRGSDQAITRHATKTIATALTNSQHFERVFAPSIDPFVQNNQLYFLTEDELALWLEGSEYNFGALLRLTEQTNLANALLIITDMMTSRSGLPCRFPLKHLRRDSKPERPAAKHSTLWSILTKRTSLN